MRVIGDMFDLNIYSVTGDGITVRTNRRNKSSIFSSPSYVIIILCIISFIIEKMPGIGLIYTNAFLFDPALFVARPWTLVTYLFLHNDLIHLFFNMFVLYFFGPALERRVGHSLFIEIFFTAGVLSAIGHTFLSQPVLNVPPGALVGASGAIYGVFAALTVLEPDILVYVYFIPMKLKYALLLFALFDFIMINSSDMIAHTAHLSGLFVGLYMGFRIKKAQERYLARNFGRW